MLNQNFRGCSAEPNAIALPKAFILSFSNCLRTLKAAFCSACRLLYPTHLIYKEDVNGKKEKKKAYRVLLPMALPNKSQLLSRLSCEVGHSQTKH